jgi:nucleoside-diphosphate-sugar epimerase
MYLHRKPKSGGKYNITKVNKGWFKKGSKSHNKKPNPQEHEHKKIRQSSRYKKWRESVLAKEGSFCKFCGSKEDINVDHIRPFASFPSLRFNVDNGRVLCEECHKNTPTYGKKCKRILITGIAGYLGDAVAQTLLNQGHYVYGVDNLTYAPHYMREHELLDFYNADVTDSTAMESVLSKTKPDCIIHLASVVGDGACSVNPKNTTNVNENSTKFLSEHSKKNGIRMIFTSTCSVFGANNDFLVEGSPTKTLSLYAGAKLNAEKYVENVASHFVFRLGTLYGLSTSFARIRCDLVANILTTKAIMGEDLQVFGGEQYRPILHVIDAAEIIAKAATKKYKKDEFGTYILSERNYKIIDLANAVSNVVSPMIDRSVNIVSTDAKFEDVRNYKVDIAKSVRMGFKARIDFGFGIGELASFLLEGRIANPWDIRYHNAKFIKELSQ